MAYFSFIEKIKFLFIFGVSCFKLQSKFNKSVWKTAWKPVYLPHLIKQVRTIEGMSDDSGYANDSYNS